MIDPTSTERLAQRVTFGASLLIVISCFLPWFGGNWENVMDLDFVPGVLVLGALCAFATVVGAYGSVALLAVFAFLITMLVLGLSGIGGTQTPIGIGPWLALLGEITSFIATWFAWGARHKSKKRLA